MTRASTVQHSTSNNNFQSRGNGNLQQRSFKKSHSRDRAALSTITLNSNQRNNRNNSKIIRRKQNNKNNNPFTSSEPNKSAIIICDDENSNEPSDFSHFLTPQNSPPITTTKSNGNIAQTQSLQDANSNSNSRSKQFNNNSNSNFPSSQSRSNENVILKEQHPTPQSHINPSKENKNNKNEATDDFIMAALHRCNSMTVPFQESNKNNNSNNHNNKNHLQPLQRSLSDSNIRNNGNINNKRESNKRYILDYIPFDWCLKKRLYFVSNQSLEWCKNISLKVRNAAMHQIPLQSLNIDSEIEQKQYEFYQNMVYHQYPHKQWNSSQLSLLHKFYLKNSQILKPLQKVGDKNKSTQFGIVSNMTNTFENGPGNKNIGEYIYNVFIDRLFEWMESFHSLYALFRQDFCKYIYIHFPNFFNIIFFNDNSNEINSTPSVMITNTHQSFRNNLEKQNIIFSTPLMDTNKDNNKENENNDDDEDFDMDLEELQRNGINIRMNKKRTTNGLGLRYNNKDRTIVLIEGKRNIHNFYDYLINYMHRLCLSIKKCHDVPLLFCDKIFLNSKCRLINMSKNNCGLTETKEKMYTMQLDGNILPSVQYAIIQLLSKSLSSESKEQKTTISFQLHDKMMTGINYCSKSKLFKRLKDVENRYFTSLFKIEINGTANNCIVHLQ